jgi:hypothetical protein
MARKGWQLVEMKSASPATVLQARHLLPPRLHLRQLPHVTMIRLEAVASSRHRTRNSNSPSEMCRSERWKKHTGVGFDECSIRDVRVEPARISFRIDSPSKQRTFVVRFAGADPATRYRISWNSGPENEISGHELLSQGYQVGPLQCTRRLREIRICFHCKANKQCFPNQAQILYVLCLFVQESWLRFGQLFQIWSRLVIEMGVHRLQF